MKKQPPAHKLFSLSTQVSIYQNPKNHGSGATKIKNKKRKLLVPFAGSGSEYVLAKSLRINYLGIEINPEYAFFASRWLERGLDYDLDKRI